MGAHLTPGPTGSTPPNGGISFENWAGASKQKLLLAVGLQRKSLFLRVHLTPGPTGFTHSKGGICSSLFHSLETCPSRSCSLSICLLTDSRKHRILHLVPESRRLQRDQILSCHRRSSKLRSSGGDQTWCPHPGGNSGQVIITFKQFSKKTIVFSNIT